MEKKMKNALLPLMTILFSLSLINPAYGTGSIVYVRANTSTGTAHYDLWTMNPEGSNNQRLTYLDATLIRFPAWSNDGTKILFDSYHNSGFTVNIDNVFMYDLTTNTLSILTGQYAEPGSCPCGSVSGRVYTDTSETTPRSNIPLRAKGVASPAYTDDNGYYTITNIPVGTGWVRASGTGSEWSYRTVIVTEGETTTNVNLYLSDGVFYKYHPRWSPDGARYVQESMHVMPSATTTEIESMYLNQSDKITMTPPSYDSTVWDPDWSPVEDKLVYIGWGGGLSVKDVLVSDLYGNNRQMIVDCSSPYTPCSNPKWSPDGTEIAFIYNIYSIFDSTFPEESYLYLINSDGNNLRMIHSVTGKSGWIQNPTFSPDSSQIMFYIYYPDDTANIFKIDSDGGNLVQITNDGLSLHLSWSLQTPPDLPTTTTSTSTTTTIPEECNLIGDDPPCGEVTLSEVINFIILWGQGQASLSNVVDLINAWTSG